MKPSCNPFILASALLSGGIVHATDYNWGTITQSFTINRSDWGRDMPAYGTIDNSTGDMGIYWRSANSAADRTYIHFDVSSLVGTTIDSDVSLNCVVNAQWGGITNGSTVNTINSAWTAANGATAPGITAIAGATNATGTFTTGETASWVIPQATFSGYVGSSTFYGLALQGASGTTAHFSTTSTLTGTYTGGRVRVVGGGTGDWGVVTWDDGTSTATVTTDTGTSGGSLIIASGASFALSGAGTLGGGTFSGAITAAGTLKIDSSANQTLGGGVSGAGALVKTSTGTLGLTATNAYTGGTTVNGGILSLDGGGGGAGTIRGTVTINSGATLRLNSGDVTGYNTDATRLSSINLNGTGTTPGSVGALHVATTANQTLGSAAISLTGASITGVAGSNLDIFGGSSSITSFASATTSTISGVKLNMRQNNGLTLNVADGAAATDLEISSVISSTAGFSNNNLIKSGAGTLSLTGVNTYTGATTVSGGKLVLPAGSSIGTAGSGRVTVSSSTLSLEGGSLTSNGQGAFLADSGTATFNHSSGSLVINAPNQYWDVIAGNFAAGTWNQTGGTAALNIGALYVANNSGSGGTALNLSGGSFSINGTAGTTDKTLILGVRANATLSISGTAAVNIPIIQYGHSPGVSGSGVTGTIHLEGGTLTTGTVKKSSAGTAVLNFNGGQLKAAESNATFVQGLTRANVRDGGARIDTNGYDITIAQALEHSDVGGDSATDGGLTKSGSGTLNLTGASSYTGNTAVNAGTLLVNGSLGSGAVTVASGATLGGSGTIGGALNVNGALSPGNSPGTLTLGNTDLTLGANSTAVFELGGTTRGNGASNYDSVLGINTLTLDGAWTVSLVNGFSPAENDSFDLFDAAAVNAGAFNPATDLTLPTLGGGLTWNTSSFTTNGVITVVPEPGTVAPLSLGLAAIARRRRNMGSVLAW